MSLGRLAAPVLTLCALLCAVNPGWSQSPVEVAAILDKDSKIQHIALDRFRELSQQAGRLAVTVVPYLLEADPPNGPDLAATIQAKRPRLVFAIGPAAAQLAKDRLRDVPIVYSMVINPPKQNLVGGNTCGISLDVSPKEQLAFLIKVKPAAKRVAVIYNPVSSDNVVDEADAFARTAGILLVRKKAATAKDAILAIKDLESEALDAFLMILDPVIANNTTFDILAKFSIRRGIALVVPADPFVKVGALLSVGADYNKIGDQAWEIARRILQGEAKPSDIGMRRPEATILAINGTIARALGLEIPRTLKIDFVY